MNNHLEGFDNSAIINATFKSLVETLHDPELPYAEISAILASLSGRMPSKLEDSVRTLLDAARGKGKGSPGEFPATRVKKQLDHYLADVRPQERTLLRAQLTPIFEVVERYAGGLKSHEVLVITKLLAHEQSS